MVDWDIICGVSVGALNGAYVAMCPKGRYAPEQAGRGLTELWRNLSTDRVCSGTFSSFDEGQGGLLLSSRPLTACEYGWLVPLVSAQVYRPWCGCGVFNYLFSCFRSSLYDTSPLERYILPLCDEQAVLNSGRLLLLVQPFADGCYETGVAAEREMDVTCVCVS